MNSIVIWQELTGPVTKTTCLVLALVPIAFAQQLVFSHQDALFFQQPTGVNDKLYNSCSGVNAYYRYNPLNIMRCQTYEMKTPLIRFGI